MAAGGRDIIIIGRGVRGENGRRVAGRRGGLRTRKKCAPSSVPFEIGRLEVCRDSERGIDLDGAVCVRLCFADPPANMGRFGWIGQEGGGESKVKGRTNIGRYNRSSRRSGREYIKRLRSENKVESEESGDDGEERKRERGARGEGGGRCG